jgi:hypothetical protein
MSHQRLELHPSTPTDFPRAQRMSPDEACEVRIPSEKVSRFRSHGRVDARPWALLKAAQNARER